MPIEIFISLFLLSPITNASVEGPQKHLRYCESEIYKNLKTLQGRGVWYFIPAERSEDKVFRSSTQKVGTWVELKIKPDQIQVLKIDSSQMETWIYKKGHCSPQSVTTATKAELAKDGFDDSKLNEIVSAPQESLIYVWDPAAAFSVQTASVYMEEAKKRNLKFISILGPQADVKWAEAEVKKHKVDLGLQKLSSLELIFRGGNLHYPSVFFVGHNKISERLMGGLEKNNVSRFFDKYQGTSK